MNKNRRIPFLKVALQVVDVRVAVWARLHRYGGPKGLGYSLTVRVTYQASRVRSLLQNRNR